MSGHLILINGASSAGKSTLCHTLRDALPDARNNLVVDYIAETPEMWAMFCEQLRGQDVFLVGLRCPVEELERREQRRGDRGQGDARRDAQTVHTFTAYDLELDCLAPLETNVERVIQAWQSRSGTLFLGH